MVDANALYAQFKLWCDSHAERAMDRLELFEDGSGSVMEDSGTLRFAFNSFDDALALLSHDL